MDIAEEIIPKTSAVPKRFNKPWFYDICKDAINELNRALERFKCEPTEGNMISYRIDIRHSKKPSRRNYVSNIGKICLE